MSSASSSVWWTAGIVNPRAGYSCRKMLNPCGQCVTTLRTPVSLIISIAVAAIIWKRPSSPSRFAGSPQQGSARPRVVKLTPAARRTSMVARATALVRSS